MNNNIGGTLKDLIKKYGTSLCDDPKRCRALLLDYCGDYKTEIFVLIKALEVEIPSVLLSSRSTPYEILKGTLAKKLCDEFAVTEQAATWSVGTWAFALEVKSDSPKSSIIEDYSVQYLEKANVYFQSGGYEAAIVCYDKVLELEPKNVKVWNNKGDILSALSRYEEAVVCYDRVLALDPNYADAWYGKALTEDDLGHSKEAVDSFKRFVTLYLPASFKGNILYA